MKNFLVSKKKSFSVPSGLRSICVVLLLLLAIVEPVRVSADTKIDAAIEAFTDDSRYVHSLWGILIVDSDKGSVVYEKNADKLFIAASVAKLFSAAAALDLFGPKHRFETLVYRRGSVTEGRLVGDLILVGGGDFAFGLRAHGNRYETLGGSVVHAQSKISGREVDPLEGLNELAQQILDSGIREIKGDILVDNRLFETLSGKKRRIAPLVVNENMIDIHLSPTVEGELSKIGLAPESATLRVKNRVFTGGAQGEVAVRVKEKPKQFFVARGSIPAGKDSLVISHAVRDPGSFVRTLFIDVLRKRGIELSVSSGDANPVERLPHPDKYQDLTLAAKKVSPPFSELLRLVLKLSHNLYASFFPMLLSSKEGDASLQKGLKLLTRFLAKNGVNTDGLSFGGGIGASRTTYVSPRSTVALLRYMANHSSFSTWYAALPVLGVDGTLLDAVPEASPVRGNVHAKTGTLIRSEVVSEGSLLLSSGLAGYMTTSSGRKLVFSLFVNHVPLQKNTDPLEIKQHFGKFCENVYRLM